MKNKTLVTEIYKLIVYIVDITLVLLSIYLAFMFKFDFNPPDFNYQPFTGIIPFIVIAFIIFMYVYGLNDILKPSFGETVYSTFLSVVSLFVTTAFITFFARGFAYPRSVLVISSLIQFITLIAWRVIVWKLRRRSHGVKDALVIGNNSAEYITRKLLLKQRDLYNVKYICDSKCDKLNYYLNNVEVVFISNDVEFEVKSWIVDNCLADRKSIYILPGMYEIAMLNSKLSRIDDVPMLKVQKLGLTVEQKIIKRCIDILVSIIGIVLSSPIMLISALIIKITDGGSPFYTQERVTINEKKFKVLKFRTMIMNAEKLTGPVLAGEYDPRITKFGKFIRATRIDELPQLFNVLAGNMSIVGPRPERPFFVDQFKHDIPDFKYRTLVKAGLTGLAQVLGKYTTTAEDKVRYDILYIKNYSLALDLKLILQTIKIIFMRESSAGIKDEMPLNQLINFLNLELTIEQDTAE
jgi:exopolysaccharide biosynthesis polyprenyl glycosylphosphotransferase